MVIQLKMSESLAICLVVVWSVSALAMSTSLSFFTYMMMTNRILTTREYSIIQPGVDKVVEGSVTQARAVPDSDTTDKISETASVPLIDTTMLFKHKTSNKASYMRPGTSLSLKFIGGIAEPHFSGKSHERMYLLALPITSACVLAI